MHWFDITVLALAIISVIYGYISGLLMQLALLVGVVLGGIFSGVVADKIFPFLINQAGMQPHIAGPLSYIVAFLIIMLAVCLLARMLQSVLKAIKLNFLNRLAGAVFCFVGLVFVLSIGLNLLIEFDRSKSILTEEIRTDTRTFPIVQSAAPAIIPYLRFDWIEQIDK